jgi:hypothetical protein
LCLFELVQRIRSGFVGFFHLCIVSEPKALAGRIAGEGSDAFPAVSRKNLGSG